MHCMAVFPILLPSRMAVDVCAFSMRFCCTDEYMYLLGMLITGCRILDDPVE